MNQQCFSLDWQVGHHPDKNKEIAKMVPATVPGAVQLDWAKSENYSDPYYADNWKDYLWMEDQFWTYRSFLPSFSLKEGESLIFISGGIDYRFDIYLDGKLLLAQEGMFTPIRLNLSDHGGVEGSELCIIIYPVPKSRPDDLNCHLRSQRQQADQCCKPAVSYGWDWHPRLIPSGIWQDTYLEVCSSSSIVSVEIDYQLNHDCSSVDLAVQFSIEKCSKALRLLIKVLSPEGTVVIDKSLAVTGPLLHFSDILDHPQLWWPHDHGPQSLYEVKYSLVDDSGHCLQNDGRRFGFRRIQLVNNPENNGLKGHPLTRNHPPITLEINGRMIFAKGSNWLNPDIFPGRITRDVYHEQIKCARAANLNLLRVWGGGIVNKESFYELCDEEGLLVWTEFPLACNPYPDTPHYLSVLDQESKSIIRRVRQHPSQAIWCGGNELFNDWSGMNDQSLALRLLNRNCFDLDPHTPFIPTSPVYGMAHGYYAFRHLENGKEAWALFQDRQNTAYTEFGCPGPSSVETIRSVVPKADLWPPKEGTAWESHHGFKAWVDSTWLCQSTIEYYFGPCENLEALVNNGQLLQSEGYKGLFEEARRQKPQASMAINWCFNEPWPAVANNSLIAYPNDIKPAYYAVKDACRPIMASARIGKFQWKEDELFQATLWLLNDRYETVSSGKISAWLQFGNERYLVLHWDHLGTLENQHLLGPMAQIKLPHADVDRFQFLLEVEGRPELNSKYTLSYRPKLNGAITNLNITNV